MGDLGNGICPTCEEAPRTFRGDLRVATLAIVIEDNNRLRAALRTLGECRRCDGRGHYWPSCSMCRDSTTWDHECPPRQACDACDGTGIVKTAREALAMDRVTDGDGAKGTGEPR